MNTQQWLTIIQLAFAAAQAAAIAEGVDPKVLGYIQTGINATVAGVNAVKQAQTGVDPASLQPIEPIA